MSARQSVPAVPRIIELAALIQKSVIKLQENLDAVGAPTPSFEENAPLLPPDVDEARDAILDATSELNDLLTEPINLIHRLARSDRSACLQTLARFDIASLIPPTGRRSFAQIASETGLIKEMVGRIIRHAATMRIFAEPEPGFVVHTTASKMLARPEIRDWMRTGIEELGSASTKFADALEKWPSSQEPNETGFSLANNTSGSIYDVIMENPDRATLFANAMKVMTARPEFDLSYATDYYDWSSLGSSTVVDVGGAQGQFAMALAQKHNNLHVTVQDMASVIEGASCGALAERVRLVPHDLFEEQDICADVYFFRWIFHNWSDKYCLRIIKAQIPALRPGAKVVVQEVLMPEVGTVALWKEKDIRSMDLEMAFTFNGRERTLADWKALFKAAHSSFEMQNVIQPKSSALGILEFVWKG